MNSHGALVVGDKVEMLTDESRCFKTAIREVAGNGLLVAAVPSYVGKQIPLHKCDELSLAFYRETGRYSERVKITGFIKKGGVQYVRMKQISAPVKDQRRESFRVPVRLRVTVCEYTEEIARVLSLCDGVLGATKLETVESKDISATGIAIITKREYRPGEKRLLKIFFNDPQGNASPFTICAEVVRIMPMTDTDSYHVGMRFINQTEQMNRVLSKFVQGKQQEQMLIRRQEPQFSS